MAGVISDETGSGSLVFGTSPTLTTSTISGSTIFNGKEMYVGNATDYIRIAGGSAAATGGTLLLFGESRTGNESAVTLYAPATRLQLRCANNIVTMNTLDMTIETGNLVIGTSGKGIDFSSVVHSGSTSKLLADYETGTWTPSQGAGLTVVGSFSSSGKYVKVGNLVTVSGEVEGSTSVAVSAGTVLCGNLPYTSAYFWYIGSSSNGSPNLGGSVYLGRSATTLYSSTTISATSQIIFTITYSV